MTQTFNFTAIIEDAGRGGAYVTVPFNVEQVFGKKRVMVKAWLGGEFYRGSLVRMGRSEHILGVRKEIREKLGKAIGDEIEVVLEEDTEPRTVAIPQDLQRAFESEPLAQGNFGRLAYSHQKETVQWIEEAKRAETRQKRIAATIARLKEGTMGR